MSLTEEAKQMTETVRQRGRSPTEVDGVRVLTGRHGLVTRDPDGRTVAPNDPAWNDDDDVIARIKGKEKNK